MNDTAHQAQTPAQRTPYQPFDQHPALTLPGDARVIVWPVINVEDWDIHRAMARQILPAPTAAPVMPDIANWAWHEYGMRVGFWRLKALFDRLDVRVTLSINGRVCDTYEPVAAAARDAGWEFMGHGYIQQPTHQVEDQATMIDRTLSTIERFTGRRPIGWLGPGLTQTFDTVDHLAAAGVRYIGDWPFDDLPVPFETRHGTLYTLPYSVELNDIPLIAVQHHTTETFCQRIMATHQRLHREGATQPRIMSIAMHPFLSGVPHRIDLIEQTFEQLRAQPGTLFWTGEQILDWYLSQRGRA